MNWYDFFRMLHFSLLSNLNLYGRNLFSYLLVIQINILFTISTEVSIFVQTVNRHFLANMIAFQEVPFPV